MNDVMRGEK